MTRLTAFVVLCLAVSGCSSPPPDVGSAKSAGRSGTVGDTKFAFHQREHSKWANKLKVMVWVDFNYNETTTDNSGEVKTVAAHPDGRKVEWRLAFADGKFTTLRINDVDYDPAKGTLFLVKTRGGTQVQQVSAELPVPGVDLETMLPFAKSNPDVAQFIAEASKPQ